MRNSTDWSKGGHETPQPRLMKLVQWAAICLATGILSGCGGLQKQADIEAARLADSVLPVSLEDAITSSGAVNPAERVIAAQEWLSNPAPSLDGQGTNEWLADNTSGTTIQVTVYAYSESASFFPPDQGEATWGTACRSYDVADKVTATPLECREGTPDEP